MALAARWTYSSFDESHTAALGAALVEALPPGTTVALCGPLGAGKTRLVQAMAAAVGVDPRAVTSPTFVLAQEHRGRRTIHHVDAYRLRDQDEFLELGPDEWFAGDGLVCIEWADRVLGCLPAERVEVHIEIIGPSARRFRVVGFRPAAAAAVERLADLLPRVPGSPDVQESRAGRRNGPG